jgi:outer membrane immunogenic protein
MRKLVLGSAAVAAFVAVGSAEAADLPPAPAYKAPAIVPPQVLSWTGLYLGAEGGGGWSHENFTDNSTAGIPPGTAISQRPDGGIFGGVLGYRYQAGQFVFGIEGTAAWADLKGSVSPSAIATDSLKVDSLYTATGQVGWAVNSQALPYLKGGWAGSSVNTSIATAFGGFASQTQFDNGWTVGAGLDFAAWQNLVLGVEYDYINLGYSGFSTVGVLGRTYIVTNPSHMSVDQVVGRVTYKFGTP